MWRMSNAKALIFIAAVVVAVSMLWLLILCLLGSRRKDVDAAIA